jgi:hypothetical protein
MKTKQRQQLSFGDLVMAAYRVWGAGLAAKMVRLEIKARFVVFNGHSHCVGSSMKGKTT